jgi:hypothetical protein
MINKKKCSKCYGFGWWPMGGLSPMGEVDSYEWGTRIIKCPWCGAGYIEEGERYNDLLESKKLEDAGVKDADQDREE